MKASCYVVVLAGILTHVEVRGGGLCLAPEQTYLSCQTHKKKAISLCGAHSGTLQYRFGSKDRLEMVFPQDAANGKTQLFFAHYFRASTDRTEVTFRNQGVEYAIFDYTEHGKRRAGVRLTTQTGKETEVTCAGQITSRLFELKDVLACDRDNALNTQDCRK